MIKAFEDTDFAFALHWFKPIIITIHKVCYEKNLIRTYFILQIRLHGLRKKAEI